MCLYLIPFSSKAWAKTLSTSCHWGKTKQSWNSQNQHRMWKLRVFLTQPVRSLGAGPHNWRCRARVFSLAARIETSQGEVCREYGTNHISARPLADFSPARVAQGDNFHEGEETLVLVPVYERYSMTIEIVRGVSIRAKSNTVSKTYRRKHKTLCRIVCRLNSQQCAHNSFKFCRMASLKEQKGLKVWD